MSSSIVSTPKTCSAMFWRRGVSPLRGARSYKYEALPYDTMFRLFWLFVFQMPASNNVSQAELRALLALTHTPDAGFQSAQSFLSTSAVRWMLNIILRKYHARYPSSTKTGNMLDSNSWVVLGSLHTIWNYLTGRKNLHCRNACWSLRSQQWPVNGSSRETSLSIS